MMGNGQFLTEEDKAHAGNDASWLLHHQQYWKPASLLSAMLHANQC